MSTVPLMVEPKATQIHVPRDAAGRLVDSGRWREIGVTHWHLVVTTWAMADRERFSDERIKLARRLRPSQLGEVFRGVARSPHEVTAWVMEQRVTGVEPWFVRSPAQWEAAEEIAFWFATRGQDCATVVRLGKERVAHVDAYAQTACGCIEGMGDR